MASRIPKIPREDIRSYVADAVLGLAFVAFFIWFGYFLVTHPGIPMFNQTLDDSIFSPTTK